MNLFNWPDASFMHLSRPRSHGHGCDCILVRSGPFQKAGRDRGCIHTGETKKSSELVQNRSKIRVVRKNKPEVGPVRKRTVPFSCEQKRQVHFRFTFRTCWVSTATRKCISLTNLVTLSQYIREALFSCQCFLIFRNNLLNFNFREPRNSFCLKLYYRWFFLTSLTINFLPFGDGQRMLLIVEIFCMHFCIYCRIKKLQILFL